MKKYLVKDNEGWLSNYLFNNIEECKHHINQLFLREGFEDVSYISILEEDTDKNTFLEIEKVYKKETQQDQTSDMKFHIAKVTRIPLRLEGTGISKEQLEKVENDWYIRLDDPNKALLLTLWNNIRELDEMCKQLAQNLLNIESDEDEEIDD